MPIQAWGYLLILLFLPLLSLSDARLMLRIISPLHSGHSGSEISVCLCLFLSRKADAGHNTPTAGGGGEEKRGGEAGSVLWLLRLYGLSLIKPRL
jgi:hypothetical protein